MTARIVELDAAGIRVRPIMADAADEKENYIALGNHDIAIRSADQAVALIDAIWRAGLECGWRHQMPRTGPWAT